MRGLAGIICLAITATVLMTANPVLARSDLHLYGYFSTRLEKVFSEPGLNGSGALIKQSSPAEWSFPYFNIMMQHNVNTNFKVFANLSGADFEGINVQNIWGEYSHNYALNLRVGKMYRKFGLYNEILDAVPSYFGIEPPELFDGDHLLISRTTTAMVWGAIDAGEGAFRYSFSTDNGEGGPVEGSIPLGMDFSYEFGSGLHVVGVSGYTSGGTTGPDKGVGEGSPKSGVLPWMATDDFSVFGGYAETTFGPVTLQAEYWNSPHNAVRDAASVVEVINNTSLNSRQLERFLIDPNGPVAESNVRTTADYDVRTWYIRGGYSQQTSIGQLVPYFQLDWYSNPETIASKTYGGDNEAGVADDGEFTKWTLGLAYRPVPEVAIKLDGSSHAYKFNGENVSYPELRFDVSYVFGQ